MNPTEMPQPRFALALWTRLAARPPRRWLVMAYLIGLHALLAILLLKTDFMPRLKARFAPAQTVSKAHVENMLAYHRAMDASVPPGAVVFLGDSITQSLATAAVAPHAINYGIGGATTRDLIGQLPVYQSLTRASRIYLLIGINDLIQGQAAGLDQRLQAIASTLPPGVPIVWSGI